MVFLAIRDLQTVAVLLSIVEERDVSCDLSTRLRVEDLGTLPSHAAERARGSHSVSLHR